MSGDHTGEGRGRGYGSSAPWSAADEAALRKLWAAGKSAAECARTLRRSRSSVCGKVHRMGLDVRRDAPGTLRPSAPKVEHQRVPPKPRPPVAAKPKHKPAKPAIIDGVFVPAKAAPTPLRSLAKHPAMTGYPGSLAVTFAALTGAQCKFPTAEENREHVFCGQARALGSPYCACHTAVAYPTRRAA